MEPFISINMKPGAESLIKRLGGDIKGGVKAGMGHLLSRIESHAVKEAPTRTSNLLNSIASYLTDQGFGGVVKATAPYAIFVHDGTGVYGPRKQKIVIRPGSAKALYWPGARHPVKKVVQKGVKPNPFFERAIDKADPQDSFEEGISNYLESRGW